MNYLNSLNNKLDDDDNDPLSDNSGIEVIDNKIYFYSEVERGKVLTLNKELYKLDKKLFQLRQDNAIVIHINSNGGELISGFSAMDTIKMCKTPTVSIVDGQAASAATLMSVVATERYMYRNSYMLIHQMSGGMWGKFHEMKDEMINCEKFMKTIKKVYEQYTKIPKKILDELLKKDLYLDAKECKKYGLVDEILGK